MVTTKQDRCGKGARLRHGGGVFLAPRGESRICPYTRFARGGIHRFRSEDPSFRLFRIT